MLVILLYEEVITVGGVLVGAGMGREGLFNDPEHLLIVILSKEGPIRNRPWAPVAQEIKLRELVPRLGESLLPTLLGEGVLVVVPFLQLVKHTPQVVLAWRHAVGARTHHRLVQVRRAPLRGRRRGVGEGFLVATDDAYELGLDGLLFLGEDRFDVGQTPLGLLVPVDQFLHNGGGAGFDPHRGHELGGGLEP